MEAPERTQVERKHIFAVNGAPEFLDIIRDLLQDEKYNVTTTNFVPKTFEQVATLAPNLLIIDLAVGERAGWDLLERLASEAVTRHIPIIVVSTTPALLDHAQADPARYGAQRFFHKPFDLDDLVAAIEELIGAA